MQAFLGNRSSLRICLLGGFRLLRGVDSIVVPLPAQRLLAFLGLHDRPVHRRRAAGTLWPDVDEHRANANLRSTLWRLRNDVEAVVDDRHVGLHLADDVAVDTREMREAAHRVFDGDDAGSSVSSFGFDLLPDWYDDWVLVEREPMRQIAVHALETLVPRLLARGDFAAAVETALQAVRVEPLRETAHRALICAHLAEGNRTEALRQFRVYERTLRTELNLAPSAELLSLVSAGLGSTVALV